MNSISSLIVSIICIIGFIMIFPFLIKFIIFCTIAYFIYKLIRPLFKTTASRDMNDYSNYGDDKQINSTDAIDVEYKEYDE